MITTMSKLKMAIGLNYEHGYSTIALSFGMVMAANHLETVGEYVYLWDKLL